MIVEVAIVDRAIDGVDQYGLFTIELCNIVRTSCKLGFLNDLRGNGLARHRRPEQRVDETKFSVQLTARLKVPTNHLECHVRAFGVVLNQRTRDAVDQKLVEEPGISAFVV